MLNVAYTDCVLGVIPVLKKALIKSHAKGATQKAYLCCDRAVYVSSQGWDRGWGCGFVVPVASSCRLPIDCVTLSRYRNFEMSCAALMGETQQEMYFPLLDEHPAPSVKGVQRWLETAWERGRLLSFPCGISAC